MSPFRTLSIISVLEYLILALGSALYILLSSLAHDTEQSGPRARITKQIFESLSCCIYCSKRTMQDAGGHEFTPYSRGWLVRLSTVCADRCLTGRSPKSICYYESFNHYSISTAPLDPSLSTAIEKVPSKPRQAKITQRQYQMDRKIGNIWQQQLGEDGDCGREVCRCSGT